MIVGYHSVVEPQPCQTPGCPYLAAYSLHDQLRVNGRSMGVAFYRHCATCAESILEWEGKPKG